MPTPVITTLPATDVAELTATLNGTVNPDGIETSYYFEYGLTDTYGNTSPVTSAGDGTDDIAVSFSVSLLVPGTDYHFRLVGNDTTGADEVFTTTEFPMGDHCDQKIIVSINNPNPFPDPCDDCAPLNASYILRTASGKLTNETVMANLGTGLVKNTTGSGIPTIADPDVDYQAPLTEGTGIDITADEISVVENTTVQQVEVAKAGSVIGTRKQMNLIEGTNVTLTVADNPGSDRVDVTVNSTVTSSGDVVGPGSATDNAITRFDGTSGKLIQNSGITLSDVSGATDLITLQAPGEITLRSGGDGIDINIIASSGTTSASNGGGIWARAGHASTSGAAAHGGLFEAIAGNGFLSGSGGEIDIDGGTGGATGAGGRIIISAGPGGSTSGAGGNTLIFGGIAQGGNSNGGDVILKPGPKHGAGTDGHIQFFKANSAAISPSVIFDLDAIATTDKTFAFPNLSGSFLLTNASSATGTAIPVYDGTTGKLLKTTEVYIDSSNNISNAGALQLQNNGGIRPLSNSAGNRAIFQSYDETGMAYQNLITLQNSTAGGQIFFNGGFGTSLAAANDMVFALNGNKYIVTGNTQINAINTNDIIAGCEFLLIFTGTPTIKHNTAGGAGTAKILLAGGVDFTVSNPTVLTLLFDGTSWQEVSRSINHA